MTMTVHELREKAQEMRFMAHDRIDTDPKLAKAREWLNSNFEAIADSLDELSDMVEQGVRKRWDLNV